jgi:acyl transferase domain-containing protein
LFGAPADDWNAEDPRWRHFISISENPWIKDHAVTGNYTYPGVGYVVMAIEALKQISDPQLPMSGYSLRDISFKAALNIPDTQDGAEVALSMSRMDESSMERSNIWWNFRVMSFNPTENNWIEHCTGYIPMEPMLSAETMRSKSGLICLWTI